MANRTFDALGLIAEAEVVGVTASCTGVQIDGLAVGTNEFVAVLNTTVTTGTVDGSNYYTLKVEVSNALAGTYVAIGNVVTLPATAGQYQVGFTSEQLNGLTEGANFFRVTATKVGTTATAVTYTAFISKI
jgi:Tfp pilus assembly protein PilX